MKVICVIHLPPLPGSPLSIKDVDEILEAAIRDARIIEEGGADGIIVENFGDKPFKVKVGPETVASMSIIAREIRKEVSISVGVNVLRNDGISAIAVAKAAKLDFVRVNQLFFPSIAPEGFLEPIAAELMRYKRSIDCKARVFADVNVKHAKHFASLDDYVNNFSRSLADAAIVTGKATGKSVDLRELEFFRKQLDCELYAGSGVTPELASKIAGKVDGVIVGTYIKTGGRIDKDKVNRIVKAFR